jgi:hypothetical protein
MKYLLRMLFLIVCGGLLLVSEIAFGQESMNPLNKQKKSMSHPQQKNRAMSPLTNNRSSISPQNRANTYADSETRVARMKAEAKERLSKLKKAPNPNQKAAKKKRSPKEFSQQLAQFKRKAMVVAIGCAILFFGIAIASGQMRGSGNKRNTWRPEYEIRDPAKIDVWTDVYKMPQYQRNDDIVIGRRPDKSVATQVARTLIPALDRKGDYWVTSIKRLRQNVLIFASSGYGKSNLLQNIIFSFLRKGKGGIVVDPSGELAFWKTIQNSAHVCGRDNDVYEIDLNSTTCPTFGLLSKMPTDNALSLANRICDGFGFKSEGSGDAQHYIDQEARFVFVGCQFLFDYYKTSDFVFEDLWLFITKERFRQKVVNQHQGDPHIFTLWEEFRTYSQMEIRKMTSNAIAKLEIFMHPPIYRIFNDRAARLNFLTVSEQKKFVVFRLPMHSYAFNIGNIGRMIVSNITSIMAYRNTVGDRNWDDLAVIVDEFASFCPGSFIEVFNYNRKAGLSFILALQNLAQLEKLKAHNTQNVQLDLLQACRHHLVGQQRDDREAKMWSQRSKQISVMEDSERFGRGILFRSREGIIRREVEVHEFHPNLFKKLKPWQFWIDFLEDDVERGDVRGSYGQGICFIPQLPFADAAGPVEQVENENRAMPQKRNQEGGNGNTNIDDRIEDSEKANTRSLEEHELVTSDEEIEKN